MAQQDPLIRLLAKTTAASPFPFALNAVQGMRLDLGSDAASLEGTDPADTAAFHAWIGRKLRSARAAYAVGGYGEERAMYRMSDLFGVGTEEPRTVHLGIDFWLPAGTPVHAVLPGVVHSTRDNKEFGDYGPTIIMTHEIAGLRFHTLYGHLSRPSLLVTTRGKRIEAGEPIGALGEPHENVGWPPHLHFQIIRDLDGREGDYPGVCRASERATWLARCPDPNLLLRLELLKTRSRRVSPPPAVAAVARSSPVRRKQRA